MFRHNLNIDTVFRCIDIRSKYTKNYRITILVKLRSKSQHQRKQFMFVSIHLAKLNCWHNKLQHATTKTTTQTTTINNALHSWTCTCQCAACVCVLAATVIWASNDVMSLTSTTKRRRQLSIIQSMWSRSLETCSAQLELLFVIQFIYFKNQ